MWVLRFIGLDHEGKTCLVEISMELLGKSAEQGLDLNHMIAVESAHYHVQHWTPVGLFKVER